MKYVFVISLKTGGVGLNLTAASYVYIVDPWWNPAVEQQAIDRTHASGKQITSLRIVWFVRIQLKIKFLCCRTVNELLQKILSPMITDLWRHFTREDVEYLFSGNKRNAEQGTRNLTEVLDYRTEEQGTWTRKEFEWNLKNINCLGRNPSVCSFHFCILFIPFVLNKDSERRSKYPINSFSSSYLH